MTEASVQLQNSHKIQQWLFAILRFAITLERTDRAVALAVAAKMDCGSGATTGGEFTFFVRTTVRLCDAMAAKDDAESIATLRAHLRNIEHQPLRRAFEAALELDTVLAKRHKPLKRSRDYLWKGLPVRTITCHAASLKPDSRTE
jgi:hypothetical protein